MSDELVAVMRSLLGEAQAIRGLLEYQARSHPDYYRQSQIQSIYPTADGGASPNGQTQVLFTGRGSDKTPVSDFTTYLAGGQAVSGFIEGLSLNYNDQGKYPGAALRLLVKVRRCVLWGLLIVRLRLGRWW